MSHQLILSPQANAELVEASIWYEQKVAGLGTRFIAVIGRKLHLIQQYPDRYPVRKANFREASVRIFPYLIIYKFYKRRKEIVVYSIFHSKRNPRKKYGTK